MLIADMPQGAPQGGEDDRAPMIREKYAADMRSIRALMADLQSMAAEGFDFDCFKGDAESLEDIALPALAHARRALWAAREEIREQCYPGGYWDEIATEESEAALQAERAAILLGGGAADEAARLAEIEAQSGPHPIGG